MYLSLAVLHQHHHQVIVSIVQPDASACQLAKRLNGIQGFQHTAFHLHIRACHHGTDNLRERDCRRIFIINLESAVNQIATRIAVQALFCNIKFNERLLLHSVGNSLARKLSVP